MKAYPYHIISLTLNSLSLILIKGGDVLCQLIAKGSLVRHGIGARIAVIGLQMFRIMMRLSSLVGVGPPTASFVANVKEMKSLGIVR